MTAWVESILFVAWLAMVALSDLRHRSVANAWVVAGLAAAFACAFITRAPFGVSPSQAALGALIGLAALLPFFALGMMGAADVKIFAVLGAWCGMHALLGLWIAATILAGLHSVALLIAARTRLAGVDRRGGLTFEVGGRRATPFVTCLGVAGFGMFVLRWAEGAMR